MAAFTLRSFAGEHAIAAVAIDRALSLNPNSAHAWMERGYVCCARRQPGPGIDSLERAMRLSPLDPLRRAFTGGIAVAHLIAGEYAEALDWAERTLREEPGDSPALLHKAVACAHLDRIEEARETVRQLIETQRFDTIARAKAYISRAHSSETLALYVEGLRKAGLPEE